MVVKKYCSFFICSEENVSLKVQHPHFSNALGNIIFTRCNCSLLLSHSWFAGRMDQDEAERQLENEEVGTFLIRFSTSHAENGWFVLAIKTDKAGVAQFQIEQNKSNEGAVFNICQEEREFSSLWDLVEYYEVNPLVDESEELRVYLEIACPGLPLNTICTGYRKAKGKT